MSVRYQPADRQKFVGGSDARIIMGNDECVEGGEPPRLFGVEPPRPRIAAVRSVDMNSSNAWAEFGQVFCRTRSAFLEHESAKAELKSLMPEDAKEAIGHGIRAKRSKAGAVSFDVLAVEAAHAPVQ